MQRLALLAFALAACTNPTVTVDERSLEVPRGTHDDVRVSIDGIPMSDVDDVYWVIEDPELVTVSRAADGTHLCVEGNFEGRTVVHVTMFGQDVPIYTHVTPPEIIQMWTSPRSVVASMGDLIEVRAKGFDTTGVIRDVTFESRWTMRDESIAMLAPAGMQVVAMTPGETSALVTNDGASAQIDITIYK